MDTRTEYRVVHKPAEGDRWIAQYRRWWSPFWATHSETLSINPPLSLPHYFKSREDAETWCASHANREIERARVEALPETVIRLGRLP